MKNYIMTSKSLLKRLPLIIWNILISKKAKTAYWLFFDTMIGVLIAGLADAGVITVGVATAITALITKELNKRYGDYKRRMQ